MKALALICAFVVGVNWLGAANDVTKAVLICDGKKFVYADLVLSMHGESPQHFIVVHEDSAAFSDAFVQLRRPKPQGPDVPYLSLGPITVPLGRHGVYFVRIVGDGAEVDLLSSDTPKKHDRASVEEFVLLILKDPRRS